MADIPRIDADPESMEPGGADEFAKAELRLLTAEAKAAEKLNREGDQRYWLRWFVVALCVTIIIGMGALLIHVSHWLPNEPAMMTAVILLHLAPIISMTTLAIALLIAAFRGFKDGDDAKGASIASEAARTSGLMN